MASLIVPRPITLVTTIGPNDLSQCRALAFAQAHLGLQPNDYLRYQLLKA